MVKITFTYGSGDSVDVEAHKGDTVMQAAVDNMIAGIAAECGGACSCATCHIILDAAWIEQVGLAEDMEKDLLDSLEGSTPYSRLCCQVEITNALDGMQVHIPDI